MESENTVEESERDEKSNVKRQSESDKMDTDQQSDAKSDDQVRNCFCECNVGKIYLFIYFFFIYLFFLFTKILNFCLSFNLML